MDNILAKIREIVKAYGHDLFVGLCIVLVATISYNLGRSQASQKLPIKMYQDASIFKAGESGIVKSTQPAVPRDPRVVASKNSSGKKYYYSWCTNRIKPENQIWFSNESEAQKTGYTLAGNCN